MGGLLGGHLYKGLFMWGNAWVWIVRSIILERFMQLGVGSVLLDDCLCQMFMACSHLPSRSQGIAEQSDADETDHGHSLTGRA